MLRRLSDKRLNCAPTGSRDVDELGPQRLRATKNSEGYGAFAVVLIEQCGYRNTDVFADQVGHWAIAGLAGVSVPSLAILDGRTNAGFKLGRDAARRSHLCWLLANLGNLLARLIPATPAPDSQQTEDNERSKSVLQGFSPLNMQRPSYTEAS